MWRAISELERRVIQAVSGARVASFSGPDPVKPAPEAVGLGKAHRNRRPRGSARRWYAAHFPSMQAILDGDTGHLLALIGEDLERDAENRRKLRLCPYCGSLMLYKGAGFFICPYSHDTPVHDRAREVNYRRAWSRAGRRAAPARSGVTPTPRDPAPSISRLL